jgi:hypothetical protein
LSKWQQRITRGREWGFKRQREAELNELITEKISAKIFTQNTHSIMEQLLHFLRESKERFLSEKFDVGVHIFLGNEACDADSFVSSVLYAYLSANMKSSNINNTLMLSIIPIPKRDLTLRTEIAFLLQKSGFTCWAEVLLFIDEFSTEVIRIYLNGSSSFCCCLTETNSS